MASRLEGRIVSEPAFLQLRNFDKALNADVLKKSTSRGSSVPWIKSYTAQLHDAEYSELTISERGFLADLRLLAAIRGNKIPNDEKTLTRQLAYTSRTRLVPKLHKLRALRFLEPYNEKTNTAAKQLFPSGIGLYEGESDSRLEVEVDKKELGVGPPIPRGPEAPTTHVVTPNSTTSSPAYRRAQALIQHGGWQLTDYSLKDELNTLGLQEQDQTSLLHLADTLRAAATERAAPRAPA